MGAALLPVQDTVHGCFADSRTFAVRRALAGVIVHFYADAGAGGDDETCAVRGSGPDGRADGHPCAVPEPDHLAIHNSVASADRAAHDHTGTHDHADTDTDALTDAHAGTDGDSRSNA